MYRAPKRATQKKGGLRHAQVPPYRMDRLLLSL